MQKPTPPPTQMIREGELPKEKYSTLTYNKLKSIIEDVLYEPSPVESKMSIWVYGYIDDNGKVVCPFMEEFDKAMKKQLKEYASKQDYIIKPNHNI